MNNIDLFENFEDSEKEEDLYHEIDWTSIHKAYFTWTKTKEIKAMNYDMAMNAAFEFLREQVDEYKMTN